MKKIIFITSLLIIIISLTIVIIRKIPIRPFYLNDEYYKTSEIKEITIEELEDLTDKKASFGLFVYQPMCLVSSSFSKIVEEYSKVNNITFYKIAFSKIKDTSLNKKITYYPSFVLYKNGKPKVYLDATKNEDIKYFSSQNGFESWINKYLKLKENNNNNNNENKEPEKPDENDNNIDQITLDGVTKENGKVNIYFFWGNGCPHCKKEFEFLNEIEKDYGSMFNLYTYEVWYNEENEKILKTLANALNIKVEGVPFTIIGSQTFSGFWESRKEEIKNAIETESKNNFDVYFDVIKTIDR